jgi:hypothetical protein
MQVVTGDWLLVIGDEERQTARDVRPWCPSLNPSPQRLTPPASGRRGISLLEVLISMFVIMIGLLGIMAMIPAGRSDIVMGTKYDAATAMGQGTFREINIRGFLDPTQWRAYSPAPLALTPVYAGGAFSATLSITGLPGTITPAVVLDPLGIAAGLGNFPASATSGWTMTRLTPMPFITTSLPGNDQAWRDAIEAIADPVFRSVNDLVLVPGAGKDDPARQKWREEGYKDANNNGIFDSSETYTDTNSNNQFDRYKRLSDGNYSWIATVVTEPRKSALTNDVLLSVALFHKRSTLDLSETTATVTSINGGGTAGGEMEFGSIDKPIKPGQWLMLDNVVDAPPGNKLHYIRWFRVIAAAEVNKIAQTQFVTLNGPDLQPYQYDTSTTPPTPDWVATAQNMTVWRFEGVFQVYEWPIKLEFH